ncbi:hypothetical protein [Micromonospora zamorensis]|uniref:Uncharacterized protein n=1 Tax=Micromonospora zamorensis TaxID=709883 RepID=A0ABZ1PAA6_9ACTN
MKLDGQVRVTRTASNPPQRVTVLHSERSLPFERVRCKPFDL